jgi:hypothetical protein
VRKTGVEILRVKGWVEKENTIKDTKERERERLLSKQSKTESPWTI